MKDPLLRDYRHLNLTTVTSIGDWNSGTDGGGGGSRSTISTSESGQELWPVGVKLGIVRLGYSAGKLKYTLVDEQDIVLAREYTFEARLEVFGYDQRRRQRSSGSGAVVFAYAYLTNDPNGTQQRTMILLQDLIWRRHHGPIPERKRVVHRNHISMDNRLDNLCLIDNIGFETTHVWYTMVNQVNHHHHHHHHHHQHRSVADINNNDQQRQPPVEPIPVAGPAAAAASAAVQPKTTSNDLHLTLFWAAIQQLPPEHLQQQHFHLNSSSTNNNQLPEPVIDATAEVNSASRCYDPSGNLISDQESVSYFECHYGPCVRIERCPREFSICGRCQETRYCGTTCQQLDWPYHKRYCRYKARRSYAPYYRAAATTGSSPSSTSGSRVQIR